MHFVNIRELPSKFWMWKSGFFQVIHSQEQIWQGQLELPGAAAACDWRYRPRCHFCLRFFRGKLLIDPLRTKVDSEGFKGNLASLDPVHRSMFLHLETRWTWIVTGEDRTLKDMLSQHLEPAFHLMACHAFPKYLPRNWGPFHSLKPESISTANRMWVQNGTPILNHLRCDLERFFLADLLIAARLLGRNRAHADLLLLDSIIPWRYVNKVGCWRCSPNHPDTWFQNEPGTGMEWYINDYKCVYIYIHVRIIVRIDIIAYIYIYVYTCTVYSYDVCVYILYIHRFRYPCICHFCMWFPTAGMFVFVCHVLSTCDQQNFCWRCVPNKSYMAFGTDTVHQIEWGSTFIRSSHSFVFWNGTPFHPMVVNLSFCSWDWGFSIPVPPTHPGSSQRSGCRFPSGLYLWSHHGALTKLGGSRPGWWVKPSGYDIRSLPWEITIFNR